MKSVAWVLFLLAGLGVARADLTFQFNYTDVNVGFDDPLEGASRRQALEDVGRRVSRLFPGTDATILIDVDGSVTQNGTLASAGTRVTFTLDCSEPFISGVIQRKALSGFDANGPDRDGNIRVNFEDFVFDLDDDVDQPGAFDFKSILLHELMHAMGFTNFLSAEDGAGLCDRPAQDPDTYLVYDAFLGDQVKSVVSDSGVIDVAQWQQLRVGGTGNDGLLWRGANAAAANGGSLVPLYSPTAFVNGSSVSHLDTDFFVSDTLLMEHAVRLGPAPRDLSAIEVGMLRDIGYTTATTGGGGGQTSGSGGDRRIDVFLPVDPSRACPGFYIGQVASLGSEGRWSMEILLSSGRRLLQGGLNLGGGFQGVNQPGFAAFNIANARNEPQVISVDLRLMKPTSMMVQFQIVRRSMGQQAVIFSQLTDGGQGDFVLDPGFYSVRVFGVGDNVVPAQFSLALATRFTDRAGGAFQGGVNLGGLMSNAPTGDSGGFGAICISEAQDVSFETTAGAGGVRDLRLSVLDRDRNVVIQTE